MYQANQRADELVEYYARELPRAGFALATGKQRFISAYDSAVNIIATMPITYASATIPPEPVKTLPKMPNGAIGTMKIRP